jgi:hypothetical protein
MKTINPNTRVFDPASRANEPAGASPGCAIAQSLLEEFERELGTTRKFLERVPEDGSRGGRTRSP